VLYELAWLLCSTILRVFYGFRSYGRHNVPNTGGVILAINHASFFDPVAAGCGMRRPVHFMARDTLFVSLFGSMIRGLNAFPVKRGAGDTKALKEYIARVRDGNVVMLFPEGTRTADGRIQPLLSGVGMLATRAGVPVVPTYIAGSFGAWSRHRSLPGHGQISIHYGAPISVDRLDGESKRQHQERIRDTIAARLLEMEGRLCRMTDVRGDARRGGPVAPAREG